MTDPKNVPTNADADDAPRYEHWLGVSASAFIPVLLTFALPKPFLLPMMAIAGALLVAGMAMLIRQERQPQRQSQRQSKRQS